MNRTQPHSMFRMHRYAILVAAGVGILSAGLTNTAFAAEKTFTCNPVDVGVFPTKRIHVKCSPGDGAIESFALGVTSAAEANRVLSIFSTAFATQKKLTISYDPADVSGAKIGCATKDCRLVRGVRIF